MTDPASFDNQRLQHLYADLDTELAKQGWRGPPIKLVVCGGAAIAALNPRRLTYDVDIISTEFPDMLAGAVENVARREGLPSDWVNTAARISTPRFSPSDLHELFIGRILEVYSPDDRYLLAMKLLAMRDKDEEDSILLAVRTRMTEVDDMLDLLEAAWPVHILTPAHRYNAITIAAAARQRVVRDRRES